MYSLQDSTILVSCNNHLKTGSQGLIQTGISLANGIGSNIQTFPHYTCPSYTHMHVGKYVVLSLHPTSFINQI